MLAVLMVTASVLAAAGTDQTAAAAPSPLATWSVRGEHVAQADAIGRFDLARRLMSYGSQYFRPREGEQIRVVDGDLTIAGNLMLDWDAGWDAHGLIVTGDLLVDGAIINANMNGGPFLLVVGKTQAFAVVGGGAELVFEGDAVVEDIVIGHYNDGILMFRKNLTTPVVVTVDHHLEILGSLDGRWFDVFDGDDQWSDFLAVDQPALAGMNDDEWAGLDQGVIPTLAARRSVLRSDLPAAAEHPKYGR